VRRAGELGEFLRTRRSRVLPELVGFGTGDRRRVSGLRREEVAQLAHVSADYVARLEQGRVGRPSPEIVESLAQALLLDDAERRHLFRLASATEPHEERGDGTIVRTGLELLVHSLEPSPAVLLSRRLDLLVWNPTAGLLLGPFGDERNYARLLFADPAIRAMHADWDEAARLAIAILRAAFARHPHDKALRELIDELCSADADAARWWNAHDVTQKRHGIKRYLHRVVGELTLYYEALLLPDDGDQVLTVYAASTNTVDSERLRQLSAIAAAS
jgi:transcriptional regulator with XRE-family HTH domain